MLVRTRGMLAALQAFWLTPVLFIVIVRPLQEPTPVPEATFAPTRAVPAMVKSAGRHPVGNVPSAAVTEATYTAPALLLLKLPASGWAGPPG